MAMEAETVRVKAAGLRLLCVRLANVVEQRGEAHFAGKIILRGKAARQQRVLQNIEAVVAFLLNTAAARKLR